MIPTTAADPNATDDEQQMAHSTSTLLDDNTPDSFSLFITEWNIFYNEFIQAPTHQTALPLDIHFFTLSGSYPTYCQENYFQYCGYGQHP